MSASTHLRGIVIAGVLAAVALGLGFVTLAMNQSGSHAAPPPVILKHVHHHVAADKRAVSSAKPTKKTVATAKAKVKATAKPKPVVKAKPDANYLAAVAGGLPKDVAHALAKSPVVIVQLTSASDQIAELATADAKAGAKLAHVPYVEVSVDKNGGDVQALTRAIGQLPDAPATIVYTRPTTVFLTLTGYNDRTVVEQAAENAATVASSPEPPATVPSTTVPATAGSKGSA